MGTVTANTGLATLLQTLTKNVSPQLSGVLSTPSVQAALQKASPSDVAQLSSQAIQLQEVGAMFGDSTDTSSTGTGLAALFGQSTTDSSSTSDPLLTALESALTQSNSTSTDSTSSSQSQIVSDLQAALTGKPISQSTSTALQQSLQTAEVQGLFGSANSLLDVTG